MIFYGPQLISFVAAFGLKRAMHILLSFDDYLKGGVRSRASTFGERETGETSSVRTGLQTKRGGRREARTTGRRSQGASLISFLSPGKDTTPVSCHIRAP